MDSPKFVPSPARVGPARFSLPTSIFSTRAIVPLPDRDGPTMSRMIVERDGETRPPLAASPPPQAVRGVRDRGYWLGGLPGEASGAVSVVVSNDLESAVVTDAELRGVTAAPALPVADGYDDLLSRIDSASSVSESMVSAFNDQTELLRTMDRQMGAAGLVDQMTGHLASLEDVLNLAVLPAARRPVALALAGVSTLAAWQAIDSGAVERAWRHYELAKRAAHEAEAPMYLAHAMGEQAYLLCEAGRPALGVELVRDAQRTLGRDDSPRLWAWLYATEAELCAHAGMVGACSRRPGPQNRHRMERDSLPWPA